ncbi:hypothetical protein Fmac_025148 [Flemingia macrophylla]|uniref:AAA+ ATPase domain-containing protein n=1 Tax=Flemingia macrophylla TaxID=520843 RepID=A0ABD1LT49_9FABA
MDIGSAASAIAKCLVPCISSQIGYILSYKRNLEMLETKVQRLQATKDSVQHDVDDAERNGEEIKEIVKIWKKDAHKIVAEANKLIDTDVGYCLGQCPNLWKKNQQSKKFEEMTENISKLLAEGNFKNVSYRVASNVTVAPFCRDYQALDSRTSMLNEIKQALKDSNIYMIGVHGMGGVGKTTFVNELAWQVDKDGSFGIVVIATVTSSPDVKDIQDQIGDVLLNRKLEKGSETGRAAELRQRISQEKSVLIILDDLWSELDLTKVGIPYGSEFSGCKLVITSRNLDILTDMRAQKTFDLKALQEEDSWNLFQKMAGEVVNEFNIRQIAKKVAKCCAGLPLLIVTVAKGLRKKDTTSWKDALFQLEGFEKELKKRVYPTLMLSYNWLENEELKKLFLFIGSFGINVCNRKVEELFLYCRALDFYSHMHKLSDARNRHYKLINDLKASSLLLDSGQEHVKMHDVVRDMAKSMVSYPNYVVSSLTELKERQKIDQLQKCHYIVIYSSNIFELPEELECPELKILLIHYIALEKKVNVPDNFFSGMKELKSLDLRGMKFTPCLPPSLHLLTNLRSLKLFGCNLGDIRMIGELTHLEILNLEWSHIEELPKEIGHLTHLRLLNLTCCYCPRVIPANLTSSLRCLEELYMLVARQILWGVEGSQSQSNNASLRELRDLHQLTTLEISIEDTSVVPLDFQFPANLERYKIIIGDMWRDFHKFRDDDSRRLMLTYPGWQNKSLTTVQNLSLDNLKHRSDELLHIIKGLGKPHSSFPNLETLVLCNLSNMTEICCGAIPNHTFEKLKEIRVEGCDRYEFPNLETLVISSLNNLESVWPNQLALISFCKLRKISISGCQSLHYVLPISVAKEFRNLKYLHVKNCSIENIVEKGVGCDMTPVYIERLEVDDCPNMKTIVPSSVLFQSLTDLYVRRCKELANIIMPSRTTSLPKLRKLHIATEAHKLLQGKLRLQVSITTQNTCDCVSRDGDLL